MFKISKDERNLSLFFYIFIFFSLLHLEYELKNLAFFKIRVYHCSAARGQYECLKLLLTANPTIWLRNRNGEYPIQEAFTNKHIGMIEKINIL